MTNPAQRQQRQARAKRPEFSISSAVSGIVGGDICGSRLRSLSEEEREIVSRVLGGDKSTVWHVCQNLRDTDTVDSRSSDFDLGSYAPEYRRRSCFKPKGGRATATAASCGSAGSPPVADMKSRLSVARTQEAAPCAGPRSNRRSSKLAEKVIAKHRWSEQASYASSLQSSGSSDFLRVEPPSNSPQQPPQRRSASTRRTRTAPAGTADSATTPATVRSAPSLTPQPPQSATPQADEAPARPNSPSPSASSTTFSSNSSIIRRRHKEPMFAARQAAGPAAAASTDDLRRRIRFLPLAEALDRSSGECVGVGADSRDDWDLGDVEIRRLVQRRRIDTLLMRTSTSRTSRLGFDPN
ncbi:hypothetical protein BOX15_Mlig025246g3 [Macrostomum lignano]|uniref:Uncharacterized protein n=2 Tax=Macrostomum lignano TaxID=282301 RepID=A0A1I8I8Z7_9PLAT|nr:hypothetical protein BOX15_Mlig025246g3 [Macrostomum lignano]